jgi:hypothetical protein
VIHDRERATGAKNDERILTDPNRPVGVFLLVGSSGFGKTETALALAETLYGGERNLITINMSEYQEAHTVSGLKGSPPGYVGYGEGGVLTEAVLAGPHYPYHHGAGALGLAVVDAPRIAPVTLFTQHIAHNGLSVGDAHGNASGTPGAARASRHLTGLTPAVRYRSWDVVRTAI